MSESVQSTHDSTDSERIDADGSGKLWRNGAVLRELYHGRGLSMAEIGDKLGVDRDTVLRWMDHHNIDRRGYGGHTLETQLDSMPSRTLLVELHTKQGLTAYEIAKKLDVHKRTVRKALYVHEVPPP